MQSSRLASLDVKLLTWYKSSASRCILGATFSNDVRQERRRGRELDVPAPGGPAPPSSREKGPFGLKSDNIIFCLRIRFLNVVDFPFCGNCQLCFAVWRILKFEKLKVRLNFFLK